MDPTNLDEFTCCLSSDRHFIIQPMQLTKCGHLACKECFPKFDKKGIQCKKCDVISEFNLITSQVSTVLDTVDVKCLYENMFQTIEKEISSKIDKLKSNLIINNS
jgi:hypothetical protein